MLNLKKDLNSLNEYLESFKKEVKYNFDFKEVNFNNFCVEKLLKTIHNLCIVENFTFQMKCENETILLDNILVKYSQIAQYHEQFEKAFKYMFSMFMKDIENIIREKTNIDTTVYISKNKFKIHVKIECKQRILSLLETED